MGYKNYAFKNKNFIIQMSKPLIQLSSMLEATNVNSFFCICPDIYYMLHNFLRDIQRDMQTETERQKDNLHDKL